ncbi:MAG: ABC transporter ATP-binding protein [Ilumatobacteraceae bacterium]
MNGPTTLALDDVSFSVGGAQLTHRVSLEVRSGDRLALIGPNGAGKTTLMNLVSGVCTPTAGRIRLGGHDITRWNVQRRSHAGLARTFQITNLLPSLTVAENLALAAGARHRHRSNPLRSWRRVAEVWARVDELVELGRLHDIATTPVGALAYGLQRRLEVMVALARPAAVVLLDEPGAGLTLDEAHELLDLVLGVAGDAPLVFVDHDLDLIARLATRLVLLDHGCLVADGDPAEVTASDVFRSIYLEGDRRA